MKDLHQKFQKFIDNGLYQGAEWKINHRGNIFEGTVGYSDLSKPSLLQRNSIYRIWSMTKPIVSVAILQLIDEKKLALEDPLNLYLPIFDNLKVLKNESSDIDDTKDLNRMPTIKDLLLHTAGFSYGFLGDEVGREYERKKLFLSDTSSLEEEINILSTCPLLFEPSKKWRYSVSVDVLGRIVEVITKDKLQNILEKKIFKPLEMNDTGFRVDKKNYHRLVTSYEYNLEKKLLSEIENQKIGFYGYPLNNANYARGGHGLYSSLSDYSIFANMLLTGKSQSGKVILSEKILKLATSNFLNKSYFPLEIAIPGNENNKNTENDLEPYGWGLGFRVLLDLEKSSNIGAIGEFGWAGAAATYFLVDPINNLSAVLMTQVLGAMPDLQKTFRKVIYSSIK